MSDASTCVLCPVRPEEQLTSSGTKEQDDICEHSVQNLPRTWQRMRERRKKRRTQRNRFETRVVRPLLRASFMKRPICQSFSWCAECVGGRRDNPPHRRVPKDENAVPEIFMDCCFVRNDDETAAVATLLMKKSVLSSVFLSQKPPTKSPSKKIRREKAPKCEKAPVLMPPISPNEP